MPQPSIAFEQMSIALEATRGTPVTPPTHRLNMKGLWTPQIEHYYPEDALGELAEYGRSEVIRKWGEWEADGALDVWKSVLIANMVLANVSAPTTPGGATNSRLWTFVRTMTSDAIKSATGYWGDAAAKVFQGAFAMLDEWVITSDATGTDGTKSSVKGHSQFVDGLGVAPAIPALALSPLLVPGRMQAWLDTSSAIGTTSIMARILSAEHRIPTGVTYHYAATGPEGGISYEEVGRLRTHPVTKLVLKAPDMSQFDNFKNGDLVKLRVRHNGPLIEDVAGTKFFNYVEVDTYGKFSAFSWGDQEGALRTIEVEVRGEKDATLGSDCRVAIQNNKTNLATL